MQVPLDAVRFLPVHSIFTVCSPKGSVLVSQTMWRHTTFSEYRSTVTAVPSSTVTVAFPYLSEVLASHAQWVPTKRKVTDAPDLSV